MTQVKSLSMETHRAAMSISEGEILLAWWLERNKIEGGENFHKC